MPSVDLTILNIGELSTLAGPRRARCGSEMADLGIVREAGIAIRQGRIVGVGPSALIRKEFPARKSIDAGGRCATPGLVDAHTHLVFAGARADEFEQKLRGVAYLDIAKAGGGILSTVAKTRAASKSELAAIARVWIRRMLSYGTTSAEVKSGYGLTTADELKQLEVIQELSRKEPMTLVPTFLGAHETPPEFAGRRSDYVSLVVNEMIPAVAERKLAKFCDVFCEVGVFSTEESKRILEAGKRAGLLPKIHAEEFKASGGADLACEVGAVSADHLVHITDRSIRLLKRGNVIAVLLPGTAFFLGNGRYAPARRMIEEGVAVAIGSDFNPGSSMSFNLPLMLSIACTQMKMSAAEALCAATVNSAYAVGLGDEVGTVEVGKQADIVLWDAPESRHLPYVYGVNLAWKVIQAGRVVVEDPDERRRTISAPAGSRGRGRRTRR